MGLKTDKNWTCNLECSVREIFQHKKICGAYTYIVSKYTTIRQTDATDVHYRFAFKLPKCGSLKISEQHGFV